MKKKEKSRSIEIEKAVKILRNGGVIIFPTDTVYGIGTRHNHDVGIARIRRIKGTSQSFPILIADIRTAHRLAKLSQAATHLAAKYWPGALTLILPSRATGEKIGLRMPDSKLVRILIEKSGFPIIATSANFHGQKPAGAFSQLDNNLIKKADFVIKGRCKLKVESTVVDATASPPKVLRKGAVRLS